ncbi:hypothetical protein [Streptomyces sp. H28]|uniref:hypothetical protein n=1 Tax=Streptomyces sp. H28 TaxID=2775865 RepID=UPI001CE17B7B|nr:hypothetical protein [Streptomyces sp. H28]
MGGPASDAQGVTLKNRIVAAGLGATGRAIASSLLQRADAETVGAAGRDPRVAGRDLGVLLGGAANGVVVVSDPTGLPAADLAVVATVSDPDRTADALLALPERSYNVLSICVAAGDDYRIVGEEQAVDLRSSLGFDSFLSTVGAAVEASTAVVEARPGLLSMGGPACPSGRGQRRAASGPGLDRGHDGSGLRRRRRRRSTSCSPSSRVSPKNRPSRPIRRTGTGARACCRARLEAEHEVGRRPTWKEIGTA